MWVLGVNLGPMQEEPVLLMSPGLLSLSFSFCLSLPLSFSLSFFDTGSYVS